MSEFSLSLNIGEVKYTVKGRKTDTVEWDTPMPHEPSNGRVQWFVRINDETNQKTAIVRPWLNTRSSAKWAAAKAIEHLAMYDQVKWYDIIPADDPRLQ